MSLVFCIIYILQEFPYFASAISTVFAGISRFFHRFSSFVTAFPQNCLFQSIFC